MKKHLKRVSQLSRAEKERIAKNAGVPVAAGVAFLDGVAQIRIKRPRVPALIQRFLTK